MTRQVTREDTYKDILLKLIPAEIVGAYIGIIGFLAKPDGKYDWMIIATCILLFVLTPFYLNRIYEIKKISQLVISAISFLIWTFSLNGGILITYYKLHTETFSMICSVIIILWTLIVPIFSKEKPQVS